MAMSTVKKNSKCFIVTRTSEHRAILYSNILVTWLVTVRKKRYNNKKIYIYALKKYTVYIYFNISNIYLIYRIICCSITIIMNMEQWY